MTATDYDEGEVPAWHGGMCSCVLANIQNGCQATMVLNVEFERENRAEELRFKQIEKKNFLTL